MLDYLFHTKLGYFIFLLFGSLVFNMLAIEYLMDDGDLGTMMLGSLLFSAVFALIRKHDKLY